MRIDSISNGKNNASLHSYYNSTPSRNTIRFTGKDNSEDSFASEIRDTNIEPEENRSSSILNRIGNFFITEKRRIQNEGKTHYKNILNRNAIDEMFVASQEMRDRIIKYSAENLSKLAPYSTQINQNFDYGNVRNTTQPDGTAKFEYQRSDYNFNTIIVDRSKNKIRSIVGKDVVSDIQYKYDFEDKEITIQKGFEKLEDGTVKIQQEYIQGLNNTDDSVLSLSITKGKDGTFVKYSMRDNLDDYAVSFDTNTTNDGKITKKLEYVFLPNSSHEVYEDMVIDLDTGISTIGKIFFLSEDKVTAFYKDAKKSINNDKPFNCKVSYVDLGNGKLKKFYEAKN